MQLRILWEPFAAAPAAWLRGLARFTPGIMQRKRAGKSGSQSALLQAVLESVPEIIFVKDREGRVITANPAYFASFGRRPEQVLGFNASAFVSDPQLLQLISESDQRVLSTGKPLRQEFCYRDPAGSRRFFETRLAPLFGQSGRVEGLVGVVLDLTKVKTTEGAWRASEACLEGHNAALARLHEVSSRLWHKRDLCEGFDEMLAGAIELLGADMGNVQILDPARGVLEIAAQRGFGQDFLDFFREVSTADDTACGRAFRSGERVVIEDIEVDPDYTPYRPAARAAGYRAVQSTPIIARGGVPLGMLSTHFRQTRRPPEQSLSLLDLYVRQAADFIERCVADDTLRKSEERLQLAQQAGHVGVFDWDTVTNSVTWTPELEKIFGLPRGGFEKNYEGWRKRVHPEDLQRLESLYQDWLRSTRDEEQWEYRFFRNGEVRWMMARGRALRDSTGRAIRVVGTNLDITERKAADLALRTSEERLRLAAETARFGIHDYDAAADRLLWSPELYAMAGLAPGIGLNNEIMMSTVHPEDRQKVMDAIREALSPAGRGIFDEDFRIVRHDTGETRWVQNRCQTLFRDSPEGRRIARNVGVAIDITERKKREEQLQMLMREVNHRAKNLLAVVQSIAHRTSNSGAGGEFAAIFQERLAGLAACQELLVASEWEGISLVDLIHAQLSPFEALKDRRLVLEGPALAINPSAAQTLGMAIHELGTNAAKYGALSNESGMVHITWDVMRAPGPRFRLSWIEQGGPAPVQPVRRGFGTTVLTEMTELGLDAEILLEFAPPGLMWQMTAPAALVLDGRAQPSFDA